MSDLAGAVARYWDAAAASFDEEADHGLRDGVTRSAWTRVLASWMPAGQADVLDVGCGTGSLSLLLAQAGHRVTGVDLSPEMIMQARRKLAEHDEVAEFVVGDAARPPVAPQRFDVVLSRHLVWTLPEPEAALRCWVSLLRPGGRLVLIEGRWGHPDSPYVQGGEALAWDGGVPADDLRGAVAPLVRSLSVEDLSADPDLWGRQVDDERYALLAWI